MGRKIMLMLAAGLTGFLLVLAAGAVTYVMMGGATRAQAGQPNQAQGNAGEQLTSTGNGLQQSNLENAQPTEMPAAQDPPASAPTPEPAPSYAVTPDDAAAIALSVAPRASLLAAPQLVDFAGTVAYEVQTDRGTLYVDASTGSVLYNGVPNDNPFQRGRHFGRQDPGEQHEPNDGND